MNEAKTRDALTNVHTPKLDALQASIPKMRTAELIALIAHPEILVNMLDEDASTHGAAALLAITDEIDRRIPVP